MVLVKFKNMTFISDIDRYGIGKNFKMSHSFQIWIGMVLVKFTNVTFISDIDRYGIGKI